MAVAYCLLSVAWLPIALSFVNCSCLKPLLSILFIGILLFSLCGYRLVIDVLQQKAQSSLSAQINRGIAEQELISLKVPASLPYYTNSKDFQYISGEVRIDGTLYQYVKRRIYNDTIEYLCLRNPVKTKLLNAREQFYQLAYNLQVNNPEDGQQHTVIKPLLLEYCPAAKMPFLPSMSVALKSLPPFSMRPLLALPIPAPAQPPERNRFLKMC